MNLLRRDCTLLRFGFSLELGMFPLAQENGTEWRKEREIWSTVNTDSVCQTHNMNTTIQNAKKTTTTNFNRSFLYKIEAFILQLQ